MSDSITLSFEHSADNPVDLTGIVPDALEKLSEREIAALPVWVGRRKVVLGDVCTVRGGHSCDLHVEGRLSAVNGIGAEMRRGRIIVTGDTGRDVGRAMGGGLLEVNGSVGDGAGVALSGGRIKITGRAGDDLGGALPGASRGTTGGEILVGGSVGRGAGASARRGLIVVGGDAGDGVAHAMIAGTMLIVGRVTGAVGHWNKRGSVVALGGATIPATYRYACTYRPVYLRVLFAYLRQSHAVTVEDRFATGRYARHCGDLSELGKGELLTWAGP